MARWQRMKQQVGKAVRLEQAAGASSCFAWLPGS